MFQRIHEIIDDKEALVCVLIDEVCLRRPSVFLHIVSMISITKFYFLVNCKS